MARDMTEHEFSSPIHMARIRFPWILSRFLSGVIAVILILTLGADLPIFISWGAFIPLILGMVSGLGSQSSTIVSERLTLRSDTNPHVGAIVLQEIVTGALLGLTYSLITLCVLPTHIGIKIPNSSNAERAERRLTLTNINSSWLELKQK